jgi:hypothetical protein
MSNVDQNPERTAENTRTPTTHRCGFLALSLGTIERVFNSRVASGVVGGLQRYTP